MNLEDFLPALQVRQLHRHPAVKASGTGQGGVKGFRAVGSCQNDDAGVALKAVHLGEQLVQGLLPFVVAAHAAGVSFLADGIDLVYEHDAGSFFFCLLKQIAHLGSTHAHEHLHKFGAGHGEEGHVCFACNSLCQHGLAGARRAHQQNALGHGSADFPVLVRVVQIVHDFRQIFLGLVLARHIGELDAVGGFHIDLGVGFSHVEGHGTCAAACPVHQLFGHELPQHHENNHWQNPGQQNGKQRRSFLNDLAGEYRSGVLQTVNQTGVVHQAGFVNGGAFLIREQDLVVLHLNPADVLLLRHGHKGAVVGFPDLPLQDPGHQQQIEEHNAQKYHKIVVDEWFLWLFDFVHSPLPSRWISNRLKNVDCICSVYSTQRYTELLLSPCLLM